MTATNELGTRVTYVAVVDDDGQVFSGTAIADRAPVDLKPSSHDEALRQLRQVGHRQRTGDAARSR